MGQIVIGRSVVARRASSRVLERHFFDHKMIGPSVIVAIGLTLPAFGEEAVKVPDRFSVLNLGKSAIRGDGPKGETLKFEGDTTTIVGFVRDRVAASSA